MEVQEVGFYKSKGDANAGRWLQALVSSLGTHAKGFQQQTQLPTGELGARGTSALFKGVTTGPFSVQIGIESKRFLCQLQWAVGCVFKAKGILVWTPQKGQGKNQDREHLLGSV